MQKKLLLSIITAVLVVGGAVAYGIKYENLGTLAGLHIKFISGTEYQQGEPGETIIQVVDAFGMPVTSVSGCNVSIWYPDKTLFVDNQPMTQGGATGSWYYKFTTPFDQIGVYEEYVNCNVTLPGGMHKMIGLGSSFHVSEALTTINRTASASIRILS